MHRRQFMGAAALGGLAVGLPAASWAAEDFAGLANMAKDAQPIGAAERQARLAKVTELLRANDMEVLLIEPGARLIYFTEDRKSTRLKSSHSSAHQLPSSA